MSINKVTISGNLTRDMEVRSTASGLAIGGFGIAVNDRRKNQQTGEWEDYPNFIDCKLFGSRAEKLQPYLVKGAKVALAGKLSWSQWEKDGQKRSKLEVVVDDIELMSSRDKPVQAETYDEDLPF
jgi:single-strand DNA-binding protein